MQPSPPQDHCRNVWRSWAKRHCYHQGHLNIWWIVRNRIGNIGHWMFHRNGIPFNFPNAKAATFSWHVRLHDCPILDHRPLFFLRLMRINLGGIQWLPTHRVSLSWQVCNILPWLRISCTTLLCHLIFLSWAWYLSEPELRRVRMPWAHLFQRTQAENGKTHCNMF